MYSERSKFSLSIRAVLKCCLPLFLFSASAAIAFDDEIHVDGQLVPAELFDGHHEHQTGIENFCPPLSDIRERDNTLKSFIRVKVAEERKLKLDERALEQLSGYQEELDSERAKNNSEYRSKYLWLALREKANSYWRDTIGKVTDEEIKAQYDILVANKDPRFVDAPFFKLMIMESSDQQYLKQLADRLRAGELWRHISKDIDPTDWNSHLGDMWFTFDRLDRYNSKAFNALGIEAAQLDRNDVIGPLSEVKRYRLIVILDKTVEPIVPLNAKLMGLSAWAAGEIRGDLYQQKHNELNASLIAGVEITQNGEPITIALEHERCPS